MKCMFTKSPLGWNLAAAARQTKFGICVDDQVLQPLCQACAESYCSQSKSTICGGANFCLIWNMKKIQSEIKKQLAPVQQKSDRIDQLLDQMDTASDNISKFRD